MRKLSDDLSLVLPPVELFREDIDQMFEMMKEFDGKSVIETLGYEIYDSNELKDLKRDRLPSLVIHGNYSEPYRPYISIDPEYAYLAIQGVDFAAHGIFNRMKDFLFAKRRHNSSFFVRHWNKLFMLGLLVGAGGVGGAISFAIGGKRPELLWGCLIASISGYMLMGASHLIGRLTFSQIWNKSKSDHLTSWQRLDQWLDFKGATKKVFTEVVKALLWLAAGAVVLYLYQNASMGLR
ncbi:MAG: hypothetical protein V1792_21670 [Pseudomonadota bacterium]